MGVDLRDRGLAAEAVREALGLAAHPEGGWYRELWRDAPAGGGRGAASGILFLLGAEDRSVWHRVDAAEFWLWHAGAPLILSMEGRSVRLGPDLGAGEVLQAVVPAGAWQAAAPVGGWGLVSCVVAPAFVFSGFEMAGDGFGG